MSKYYPILLAVCVGLLSNVTRADLIDFESGFVDLQVVGSVATATNSVTFSTGGLDGLAYIAEAGSPLSGFVPLDQASGDFSLSDDNGAPFGSDDYLLDFALAVTSLSLDIFDVRGDGGGSVGDTVTLSVFADAARTTLVDSDSFVVAGGLPDGVAQNLSVTNLNGFLAATVSYGNDTGTAIDNIDFTTAVPEPSVFALLLLGLVGLVWTRRAA